MHGTRNGLKGGIATTLALWAAFSGAADWKETRLTWTPPPENPSVEICRYAVTPSTSPGLLGTARYTPDAITTEMTLTLDRSKTIRYNVYTVAAAEGLTCDTTPAGSFRISPPSNTEVTSPLIDYYRAKDPLDMDEDALPDIMESGILQTYMDDENSDGVLECTDGERYALWDQVLRSSWMKDWDNDGLPTMIDPDSDDDGWTDCEEFTDNNPDTQPWRFDP